MTAAYICDCLRTPIGRYGGALAAVRPDDLAALVLRELLRRQPSLAATEIEDVILGCANQAGEDNRNVARMAALLAGLPAVVPGVTVNRLCGSGLEAVAAAARMIQSGEGDVVVAGGVESMSRAPFVVAKSSSAYARDARMFDTTIGWRFVNPLLAQRYGVDSMPETAENVAAEFGVSRADQDHFALRSQQRAAAAQAAGLFTDETISVPLTGKTGLTTAFSVDESPRATSLAALAGLPALIREGGSVTAGNSCGLNDGAAALLLASPAALDRHGLKARAKVIGTAVVGVEPRTMGLGPAPATRKLLQRLGLRLADLDVIEVNEAFAAQALAVLRELEVADDARQVNALGGAIALGHPLGASGARLVTTAVNQLERKDGKFALCTMCIGVGQGIAMVLERVAR
jgi:3-oxoadipyl-CoA thiolase